MKFSESATFRTRKTRVTFASPDYRLDHRAEDCLAVPTFAETERFDYTYYTDLPNEHVYLPLGKNATSIMNS